MDTLIALCGGPSTFVSRLETMFTPGQNPSGSAAFNYTLFNPGNEPSFTTPYLFHFAGRSDRSVHHVRAIAQAYYAPTPSGLPGNSDAGAMESWLLWAMLGLYPLTGQTTFLIGSPWFADLAIDLGGDKKLRITTTTTTTTTGGSSRDDAYHVQSLTVNGRPWKQNWVSWHDVFANGGTMEFVLGPNATQWATGPRPPSPASEWAPDAAVSAILADLPNVESGARS
jgi:putative alpha-1,2-mannosidase